MHEGDVRPPNEKSHAYHFSITYRYNVCEFCLLTSPAIIALPKCLFKGWHRYNRGFIRLRSCSRHSSQLKLLMSTKRCETFESAKLIVHSIFYKPRRFSIIYPAPCVGVGKEGYSDIRRLCGFWGFVLFLISTLWGGVSIFGHDFYRNI